MVQFLITIIHYEIHKCINSNDNSIDDLFGNFFGKLKYFKTITKQ